MINEYLPCPFCGNVFIDIIKTDYACVSYVEKEVLAINCSNCSCTLFENTGKIRKAKTEEERGKELIVKWNDRDDNL